MVQTTNIHAVPQAAPGQLSAIDLSALPIAKSLDIPRLLDSASPNPVPPPATLTEHGVGTRVDASH